MRNAAPGHCADCSGDAYIQLAVENAMLCARCYASRLGLSRLTEQKGGDKSAPTAEPSRAR